MWKIFHGPGVKILLFLEVQNFCSRLCLFTIFVVGGIHQSHQSLNKITNFNHFWPTFCSSEGVFSVEGDCELGVLT